MPCCRNKCCCRESSCDKCDKCNKCHNKESYVYYEEIRMHNQYILKDDYQDLDFLKKFNFIDSYKPEQGSVKYVNAKTALRNNICSFPKKDKFLLYSCELSLELFLIRILTLDRLEFR